MAANTPHSDPDDRDPRENQLARRSRGPAVSLWLVILGLIILGAAVYTAMALL